jgi:hypothetical protein
MANDNLKDLIAQRKELEMLMRMHEEDVKRMNNSIGNAIKAKAKLIRQEHELTELKAMTLELAKKVKAAESEANSIQDATLKKKALQIVEEEKIRLKGYKQLTRELRLNNESMRHQLSLTKAIGNSMLTLVSKPVDSIVDALKDVPRYLNEADKSIKNLNLNLGASGENARRTTQSFIDSAKVTAQLGVSVQDLVAMTQQYADTTGRITGLTAKENIAIAQIAKGTALGAQGASQMASNFFDMGKGVVDTRNAIEGLVNSSEKLGINSGKVLQNINQVFQRSKEFTFNNGIAGLGAMAQQSEKIRISLDSIFNAAEKARTLEGSLSMASQLMVMGGNFAKADPFQLSFLARNKPDEFTKKIGDMTKGIARFNSATKEFEVTAVDMDRLRVVAEATGISISELKDSAIEASRIKMATSALFVGSKEDREMIARLSTMENGRMTVSIKGQDIDISKLTNEHVNLLKVEGKSLEQRAKSAQAFDELWGNTLMEVKATFLPLLEQLNMVLGWTRTAIDSLRDWGNGSLLPALATIGGIVLAFKALPFMTGGIGKMVSGGAKGGGSWLSRMFGGAGGAGSASKSISGISAAAGGATGSILAFGAAMIGVGLGIKLASEGISRMAESIAKLDSEQLSTFTSTLIGFGVGIGVMVGALALLATNPIGAAGLIALGAVSAFIAAIGFGIGQATSGFGDLARGMSSIGNMNFSTALDFMSKASDFLTADGANLDKLTAGLIAIKNVEQNSYNQLKTLIDKGIELRLPKDAQLLCNIEVHNDLDGEKFVSRFAKKFAIAINDMNAGKKTG